MFLFEHYDKWVKYTPESLAQDFKEYKKKEYSKWQDRAQSIGARFPIFDRLEDFKEALDKAHKIRIDTLKSVGNLTKNTSIEDIKQMVSSYTRPRDVDRIVKGIEQREEMPLPIILQGSKGTWIMAGNTRQDVTRVLQSPPMALVIDVRDNNENV